MLKNIKGFTLIELLIVVAIIAILAAIAVPNFMEAQVRAKVSRAKNDMRTVALALESYRTDQNAYPFMNPSYNSGTNYSLVDLSNTTTRNVNYSMLSNSLAVRDMKNNRIYNQASALTSPVSYISKIPVDPFCDGKISDIYGNQDAVVSFTFLNVELACKAYWTPGAIWVAGGTPPHNIPVNPAPFRLVRNMPAPGTNYVPASASAEPVRYASYVLYSAGPERKIGDLYNFFLEKSNWSSNAYVHYTATDVFESITNQYSPPYDPTNGTKSAGKIFRLSGGQWE